MKAFLKAIAEWWKTPDWIHESKGGHNDPPKTPRPAPPKGMNPNGNCKDCGCALVNPSELKLCGYCGMIRLTKAMAAGGYKEKPKKKKKRGKR